MNVASTIRHVVSIAGVVQEPDEQTNAAPPNHDQGKPPRRVAGAFVRIIVHAAPLAFQAMVLTRLEAAYADSFSTELDDWVTQLDAGQVTEALRAQFLAHGQLLSPKAAVVPQEIGSTWQIVESGKPYTAWRLKDELRVYFNARASGLAAQVRRQRIDHTWSLADGVFYFLDLPAGEQGEGYQLRVSAPHLGSRYGTAEWGPVPVHANPEGQPVQTAWASIVIAATRIRGTVTFQTNAAVHPLAGADVHLRGDTTHVLTKDDGSYELKYVTAGRPTLEVVAAKFAKFDQQVNLVAGQTQEVNVQLQPEGNGA